MLGCQVAELLPYVAGRIMLPSHPHDGYSLIPDLQICYFTWLSDFSAAIKVTDLDERLYWIIWVGSTSSHESLEVKNLPVVREGDTTIPDPPLLALKMEERGHRP